MNDLRFGLRLWRTAPGFTAIAVLVLTLGIGGGSAMFTIINAVVLRPLPVSHPEQLVRLYNRVTKPGGAYRDFSYPNYADIRDGNPIFNDLAALAPAMVGVGDGDLTHRSLAMMVSENFFATLGARLAAGRSFLPEESRPGSAIPVVVVSHFYWEKTGADPALIGKTIRLNARSFQVIGIAPKYFTGITAFFSPDFWLPLGVYELLMFDSNARLDDRRHDCLMLVGRLKTGSTMPEAQSHLPALARALGEAHPEIDRDHTFELGKLARASIDTAPSSDADLGSLSLVLMTLSGTVLVIACLNLANMLLARGASRSKEIAIRAALGSGRGRLVRQLLTESLLLALLGGLAGLWVANWSTSVIASSVAPKLGLVSISLDTRPDWRILGVTFGCCLFSVLLFGLAPAWKLSNPQIGSELKANAGGTLAGLGRTGRFSLRDLLVVGQLALSLALLTSAGLVAHGAFNAARANPGFSLEKSVLVETDASLGGNNQSHAQQLYLDVLQRLRALPGVQAASLASLIPFGVFAEDVDVRRAEGSGTASLGQNAQINPAHQAGLNIIGDDYFKTLGISRLRGRDFDRREVSSTPVEGRIAIVDEPLARMLFPGENPLGRRIRIGQDPDSLEIVGLVAGVFNRPKDQTAQPHLYLPFGKHFRAGMNFHLRIAGTDPGAEEMILASVRPAIRSVDPRLAVLSVQTLRQFHETGPNLWVVRTGAKLFGIFGGLALFLAAVGVYGVNAFLVAKRTREIGIRMAVGATTREVLWMTLRKGLSLTATGLGLGLLLALASAFLLRSALYGVQTLDPVAFTLAPACLVGASLLACYLPARRAARIHPTEALRCE